ncbi:EthD domain-containing protein [Pseudomaricurvus sp.]|uniref:EthD domain-containing protein n=1 Tax=Pseudomaricurvus sp. TaxID=2004510 RepID=UPI003F6B1817
MSEKVYKILLFMKRRPGMSKEEFRDYYENHHVPMALKYASGIKKYVRRYLDPQPRPETGDGEDLGYDVITELWFEDEKIFEGTLKYLSTAVLPDEVIEDEKQLFDRERMRLATTVEYVTSLD